MNKKLAGVAVGVAVCLSGMAGAQPKTATPAPAAAAVDYAALADKIVGTNANVKEGQIVEIVIGPYDTALGEEIAVAVRKRGAHALVTYQSESMFKKSLAAVPSKYDAQARKLSIAIAKLVDVVIETPQQRDPSLAASLPPERTMAIGKANQAHEEIRRKRNVRFVELGNGLAPSAVRAKELGISEADLKKLYWDGLSTDYAAVEAKCTALKTVLSTGKELKITHPNGTDLTIAIKGKKVVTSDGVISDADAKAGGPGVQAWLPAGEVYLLAGKSNGKFLDDRATMNGQVIMGLGAEIKDGKATGLTAKSGWDGVSKTLYDAAGPAKNELTAIDFGCNPAIKTDKTENFIAAGVVTIGLGNSQWAGGTNKEPWRAYLHLPGATVLLDGKAIVENGVLK